MRTRTPMLISLRAGWLALPLMALACNSSPPIDPTALAAQAALNAREMVHQSGGGVAFTESSDSGLQKILTGMAHANDGLAGMAHAVMPDMPTSMPPGMSAMGASPMAQAAAGMPSLLNTEEKFDETADDLKTFLRERIFADANLESKTADEAVYWLHGEPTCRALPQAGDPTGAMTTLDTKCVDQLNKLPVRVVMRADGDGVRLTVELGPDKLELVSFVIHSNLLAVDVDFAKAYAASQYAQTALGEQSPMGGTQFEKLVGAMRISLRKDGEKKVTLSTSILSAIDIAEKSATGVPGAELKLAASDPTFALSLDGVAQTASLKLDMGALDVLGTWDPNNNGVANRDMDIAIGGLTGETTFKEGVVELATKGLGIGPTAFKIRGKSVFDLSLNPSNMNRFDLKVTVDAANEPHFEITPRFDLAVGVHYSVIASDFAVDNQPPAYLLENTYAVKLDNGGATTKFEAVPTNGAFAGGLKIDAGTLTISSSNPTPTSVSVATGMCLTGTQNPPADADPIIGALTSVACP